jgi:DNA repair protein RadC
MKNQSIKSWNEDDRPREKMMLKGATALSDAELLAILIANGTREKTALDLGKELLALVNNNLNELGRLNHKSMSQVKGIGPAKSITLMAALELGRRRQLYTAEEKKKIDSSRSAFEIINPIIGDKEQETLVVLYLNNANNIIQYEILSYGGLNATIVDIRLVLKNALLNLAPKIIIAHNHPSGNLQPSKADIDITQKLLQAAKMIDIQFLDHLIIGHNNYTSLADEGFL